MAKPVYLDHAATTPVDPVAAKAMEPYYHQVFGNASSVHSFGQAATKAVDGARVVIAKFLNCQPTEVVFTSGATESNNTAIKGTINGFIVSLPHGLGKTIEQLNNRTMKPHIVTTAIEHPSVLESCRALERLGLVEVTYVNPSENGIVRVEDVIGAIKENTVLVSVMYANNEVGTIQPIREIGRVIEQLKNVKTKKLGNKKTMRQLNTGAIYPIFHTDATQAVQFLNCRVDKLGADLLSMSAHKIYGPKGVGVLYIKKGTPITRLVDGGEQEFGWRAGTLNTPAIVGFGKSLEGLGLSHSEPDLASSSDSAGPTLSVAQSPLGGTVLARPPRVSPVGQNLALLRDRMIKEILAKIPDASLNGDSINRLPNNVNIRFNGIDAQTLVMALDQEGIAVSAGSACAAGAPAVSHVITAMLGEQVAKESVRFTIGKHTSDSEITEAVKILEKTVSKMRSFK